MKTGQEGGGDSLFCGSPGCSILFRGNLNRAGYAVVSLLCTVPAGAETHVSFFVPGRCLDPESTEVVGMLECYPGLSACVRTQVALPEYERAEGDRKSVV